MRKKEKERERPCEKLIGILSEKGRVRKKERERMIVWHRKTES